MQMHRQTCRCRGRGESARVLASGELAGAISREEEARVLGPSGQERRAHVFKVPLQVGLPLARRRRSMQSLNLQRYRS